ETYVAATADLQFDASAVARVNLIAGKQRQILDHRRPFASACALKRHVAFDEADADDSADGRVVFSLNVVRVCFGRLCEDRVGEQEEAKEREEHGENAFHNITLNEKLSNSFGDSLRSNACAAPRCYGHSLPHLPANSSTK